MSNETWATLVVVKGKGGRGVVQNASGRGLFRQGEKYYNHRLKAVPEGARVNVVVRLSACGRRMVQELTVKGVQNG